MKKLSVTEIKSKFEAVMERVFRGQEIIVTRYGRPVARLIPPESKAQKPISK